MVKTASTSRFTDTDSKEVTAEELAQFCGPELYGELTRAIIFQEFVIERMLELGFDVPDDVPLHLTLDYHFVLARLMIDEYINKGLRLPTPENSKYELRESMI